MKWPGFLAAILLSGCALLPMESPKVPQGAVRAGPEIRHDYREAVGVIHVHTTCSDGSLPPESVARIAGGQGLDYLIVTDHNTLRGLEEGKEGRYGRTLLLVGEEVSTNDGHVLALRVKKAIPSGWPAPRTAEEIRTAEGLGFVAHPFSRRSSWKGGYVQGLTGLEIYSAREDVEDENVLLLGLCTILLGADPTAPLWLDRPQKPLALWDAWLGQGKRVVGIGSPNAHGLGGFGLRLGPYATGFKWVRNHLLIRGDLSRESVYEALEHGRLFVAHDLISDARAFLFAAVRGGAVQAVMGEEVRWAPDLKLYVYLPRPGRVELWKDGRRIESRQGQGGWFEPDGPGVYRVEATRRGRPWIYSNPIYVQ